MSHHRFLTCLAILVAPTADGAEQNVLDPQASPSAWTLAPPSSELEWTSGVSAILQDSRGNYWFGSTHEGLSYHDGTGYRTLTGTEGLPDNQVRSLQEDAHGTVWVETARGVVRFDGGRLTELQPAAALVDSEWGKAPSDLWFGAGTLEGVYRFDGRALGHLAFPNAEYVHPDGVYHVTDIAQGRNNMVWMATYAAVFGYNGERFRVINDRTIGAEEAGERLHVRSVFEDAQGRLWIGNNGIGVWLDDGTGLRNFSQAHGLIHSGSTGGGDRSPPGTLEHVFAIAEDAQGNVWFGDRDTGAWMYDGETVVNQRDGLPPSSMIYCIYKDNADRLLFGLADGNVYAFTGESFEAFLPQGP